MDWCCLCTIRFTLNDVYFSFLFIFTKTKTKRRRRPVGRFALFSISFALSFGIVFGSPVTRRLVYFSHIYILFVVFDQQTNRDKMKKFQKQRGEKKTTELNGMNIQLYTQKIMAPEVKWTCEIHGVRIVGFFHYTHTHTHAHTAHDTHCIYVHGQLGTPSNVAVLSQRI